MSQLSPLQRLIDALAKQAANDYLTAPAAPAAGLGQDSTKPVPLPAEPKAA